MSERTITSLNISVGVRTNSTYMGDNTILDLGISTHLQNGGILSDTSQHLTLAEAKKLVAELNLAIAQIELEMVDN